MLYLTHLIFCFLPSLRSFNSIRLIQGHPIFRNIIRNQFKGIKP
jgi:hypothetical protein